MEKLFLPLKSEPRGCLFPRDPAGRGWAPRAQTDIRQGKARGGRRKGLARAPRVCAQVERGAAPAGAAPQLLPELPPPPRAPTLPSQGPSSSRPAGEGGRARGEVQGAVSFPRPSFLPAFPGGKVAGSTEEAPEYGRGVVIMDNWPWYDLNLFTYPQHYYEDLEYALIPHGIIVDRIEWLAKDIMKDIGCCDIMVLCVLKRGYKVCADLVEHLRSISQNSDRFVSMIVDFVRLNYRNDSAGEMQIIGRDDLSTLAGMNVLIVEDVVGTGRTIKALLSSIEKYKPNMVKVASLLVKRNPRSDDFKPDYAGFKMPNLFVVDYALDFNKYFRDLNHIRMINEQGEEKYRV
ncbi:LOW QUALITY PROTEIN: phosphoribosyltransferase domain-containing protein 1 [Dugong dugon]